MSIGVLLGGCGYYDGTGAHEAVFTLLAIESAGERAILIAPDIDQDRVVDHLTGDEVSERRNVMRESARLARLPIHSLADTRPEDLEALIIPGGYGPVVNFSTGFARVGERRRLRGDVETFLGRCLAARLPIGCVSLGEIPLRTTLGEDSAAVDSLRKAVYLDPTAGDAHFLLAGALARLGHHGAAAVSYRAAAASLGRTDARSRDDLLGGRDLAELVYLCEQLADSSELQARRSAAFTAPGVSS